MDTLRFSTAEPFAQTLATFFRNRARQEERMKKKFDIGEHPTTRTSFQRSRIGEQFFRFGRWREFARFESRISAAPVAAGSWPAVRSDRHAADRTNDAPKLRPPYRRTAADFLGATQRSRLSCGHSLCLLALIGVVAGVATRPRPPSVPPEVQRAARWKLRQQTEDGRVLSQVSQILRRYFVAAFALPPGEFTTTEFCRPSPAMKIGSGALRRRRRFSASLR